MGGGMGCGMGPGMGGMIDAVAGDHIQISPPYIFDEANVEGLVERILPEVLVKADQYGAKQIAGGDIVRLHGGQVVTVPMKPHYSTSHLIQKVQETPSP